MGNLKGNFLLSWNTLPYLKTRKMKWTFRWKIKIDNVAVLKKKQKRKEKLHNLSNYQRRIYPVYPVEWYTRSS